MKSKLFYTQLLGILALFVILLVAIPIYTNKIPKILSENVQLNLQKHGLNWVAVRAKGRDITLSGVAPSIALHQKAVRLAEESRGVRMVHNKISPTVITPYSMNITYRNKEFIFKGYMPSQKSKDELFKSIQNIHPNFKIIKEVDIGTGEPMEWESLMLVTSLLLEKLELGIVNIVDKEVVFSGKCQTMKQESEILLYLEEYQGMGFKIKSRVVAMDEAIHVCQEKFKELLSNEKVEFEAGKSIVKSSSHTLLKGLVDISVLCPHTKIEIEGHTDSSGDDSKNQELSQRRANAVVAKLFQFGIPLEQMESIGRGESEPITTNETKEGRATNRRIEFKVRGE
ncbi:MAG: OmpA family protein [Sulfurovaceae bacterium]|nr:OmpA family protein [Sulfurovaceae bacterium]